MNFGEDHYEDAGYGIGDVGGLLEDLAQFVPMPGPIPVLLPNPFGGGGSSSSSASDGGGSSNPFSGLLGGGSSSPSSSEQSATVTAPSGLNLRAQPNESSARVGGVTSGSVVTVLRTGLPATPAASKGWTQVRTASGTEGYLSTEWLAFGPAQPPKNASSGGSAAVVPSPSKLTANAGGLSTTKIAVAGGVLVVGAIAVAALAGGKKGSKK